MGLHLQHAVRSAHPYTSLASKGCAKNNRPREHMQRKDETRSPECGNAPSQMTGVREQHSSNKCAGAQGANSEQRTANSEQRTENTSSAVSRQCVPPVWPPHAHDRPLWRWLLTRNTSCKPKPKPRPAAGVAHTFFLLAPSRLAILERNEEQRLRQSLSKGRVCFLDCFW